MSKKEKWIAEAVNELRNEKPNIMLTSELIEVAIRKGMEAPEFKEYEYKIEVMECGVGVFINNSLVAKFWYKEAITAANNFVEWAKENLE